MPVIVLVEMAMLPYVEGLPSANRQGPPTATLYIDH